MSEKRKVWSTGRVRYGTAVLERQSIWERAFDSRFRLRYRTSGQTICSYGTPRAATTRLATDIIRRSPHPSIQHIQARTNHGRGSAYETARQPHSHRFDCSDSSARLALLSRSPSPPMPTLQLTWHTMVKRLIGSGLSGFTIEIAVLTRSSSGIFGNAL